MIDMVNALAVDYEQVFLISNVGGIFLEDTSRLNRAVTQSEIMFVSSSRIGNFFSNLPRKVRHAIYFLLILFEPLFFLINTILFFWMIRKLKPATVLACNGGYPAAQACLAMVVAGKIARVPVVLSIVSVPSRRRLITWLYDKVIDDLVWKSVSLVVVNAQNIAASLSESRGAPSEKIKVIYNGLEDKPSVAINASESPRQIVLGCVARMDKGKGVLLLFDAFVKLAKNHPEIRLVLAGQGDASAELFRRTERLCLQNKVQMLGHYEGDKVALLASFDIFIFPSLWEGLPYSIIEALRSACVIVTTRVGGIPEAVTDGVEGVLIQPGSTDEIVAAVEKLIANQKMCEMLARNARLKFEREFTLPKMHLRVRKVFSDAGLVRQIL